MTVRVELYTGSGMASGTLVRPGPLREALSTEEPLRLDDAVWQDLDESAAREAGSMLIAVDDILFALADEEPELRMHASWHHVRLESGPYALEGELATLPGFDPGRSLARPSGEFVVLREVRLSLHDRPEAGVAVGDHALVNRYAVERIEADLQLGFIFPGAVLVSPSGPTAGLTAIPSGGGVA
jgi:hypothetical protein